MSDSKHLLGLHQPLGSFIESTGACIELGKMLHNTETNGKEALTASWTLQAVKDYESATEFLVQIIFKRAVFREYTFATK